MQTSKIILLFWIFVLSESCIMQYKYFSSNDEFIFGAVSIIQIDINKYIYSHKLIMNGSFS